MDDVRDLLTPKERFERFAILEIVEHLRCCRGARIKPDRAVLILDEQLHYRMAEKTARARHQRHIIGHSEAR